MTNTSWDDPENFRPERFFKDDRLVLPDSYLPFGFGKHRCLGETLAKANVFMFTTCLLQNFIFSIPEGHSPPTTDAIDGVTPSPAPYDALVRVRC